MPQNTSANQIRNADPAYVAKRTAYLESLLPLIAEQISTTASWKMPADISVNESVTICLVLGIKEAFQNPVSQFLSVQPWLQAWILKKWKMENFIGQRIGLVE